MRMSMGPSTAGMAATAAASAKMTTEKRMAMFETGGDF
jgi:hypothetical protein